MKDNQAVLANIHKLIADANTVLVMASTPIDIDSLGTGLTLEWYFQQLGKQVKLVSSFPLNSNLQQFSRQGDIEVIDPVTFDFSSFDLIVTEDGSHWDRFFGPDWAQVLPKLDKSRIINIDHHEPDIIASEIPDTALLEVASCTSQVVYNHLFADVARPLPEFVLEWMYKAMIADTIRFRIYYGGDFAFADNLVREGADHFKFTNTNYPKSEIEFTTWALANMQYLPALKLMLLEVPNAEVQKTIAAGNDPSIEGFFLKDTVASAVEGYDYMIVLKEITPDSINMVWRTRNYGPTVEMAKVISGAGFQGGGHRNAGGGTFAGTMPDAKSKLLAALTSALQTL